MANTIVARNAFAKSIDIAIRRLNLGGRKVSFMGGLSRDLDKTYFDSTATRRSVEILRRAGVLGK
jgi:hypothetical protein